MPINDTVLLEQPKKSYDEIFLTIKNNLTKLINSSELREEDRVFIYELLDAYIKEYLMYTFAPTDEKKSASKKNLEHYESAMLNIKNIFYEDFVQKIHESIAQLGSDVCKNAILSIL